ncbi:hypothetical protein [Neolewinella agarilytica]|uniref:hypothetical protein n=1 Tax=Neolewinella agarilytica TaxID=478744 RepID=UPI0023562D60|nr:hypothetical protein [Neolewinella agarilytica]
MIRFFILTTLALTFSSCDKSVSSGLITYVDDSGLESFVIFDKKKSKWLFQKRNTYSDNNLFEEIQTYIYNDFSEKEVIEISEVSGLVTYNIINPWTNYKKRTANESDIVMIGMETKSNFVTDLLGNPLYKITYSSEIPSKAGPSRFYGFDGVVLKVEDLATHKVLYEAISYQNKNFSEVLSTFPDTSNMKHIKSLQY